MMGKQKEMVFDTSFYVSAKLRFCIFPCAGCETTEHINQDEPLHSPVPHNPHPKSTDRKSSPPPPNIPPTPSHPSSKDDMQTITEQSNSDQ